MHDFIKGLWEVRGDRGLISHAALRELILLLAFCGGPVGKSFTL